MRGSERRRLGRAFFVRVSMTWTPLRAQPGRGQPKTERFAPNLGDPDSSGTQERPKAPTLASGQ